MTTENTEAPETEVPGEQSPEETEEGSPVPNPEREDGGDAEDVPGAV
jgi:hypothetical protein